MTNKKNPCSIILDDGIKRDYSEFVAINYAFERGDSSFYRRALEFDNVSYFIIPEDKILIAKDKKISGNFFYDADKIPLENKYVFNGTFEEILREFNFEGYRLIK